MKIVWLILGLFVYLFVKRIYQIDIQDLKVDSVFEWCPNTIRYLKDKQFNICIAAGKKKYVILFSSLFYPVQLANLLPIDL